MITIKLLIIFKKNENFVKKCFVKLSKIEDKRYKKIVIQHIDPDPPYRYFFSTRLNVGGADDPVLRFVPYMENEEKHTTILNYDETLLTEDKLLDKWEAEFNKKSKPLYYDSSSFNSYFCNICLIFDCNSHKPICKKIPIYEKKNSSSNCSKKCYKLVNVKK